MWNLQEVSNLYYDLSMPKGKKLGKFVNVDRDFILVQLAKKVRWIKYAN